MFKSSSIAGSFMADPAVEVADSDLEIVLKVQSGDVAAFDRLIVKYRERLYSVIYNLTSNCEDTNDLTQDTFIKAFRSIRKFKGNSSFYTWLYRIGVNTTLNHLKKNRLRQFFSFETIDTELSQSDLVHFLAAKARTDKPTFIKELQEKLNEALQKLSLKHRTVVVLFEIEGLSHQEIAQITRVSVGTVRSRLHYAKQALQNSLKEYLK